MKKIAITYLQVLILLVFGLFCLNSLLSGQDTSTLSPSLPDEVNKIVTTSCMPCHTNTGGLMSRAKLNFTNWTQYSPEKQKIKAEKIYSELKEGAMPPKSARETRPDIIPSKDQISIIKKWAESFQADSK